MSGVASCFAGTCAQSLVSRSDCVKTIERTYGNLQVRKRDPVPALKVGSHSARDVIFDLRDHLRKLLSRVGTN